MSIIRKEQLTNPLSASYALTASYYKETDPIFTAISGTFTLTSSFNSFTSSYNTGSFTGSFTGSLFGTASWAEYVTNASTTNTGSLLATASVLLNTITFTKGDGSSFPITINTGSGGNIDISGLVTTSSFNAFTSSINTFTSSYNTGSFSGSFTGSFNGTASWARNALTASYVSSSNVYGPNGFDSVNYATSAGSAGTATTADTANAITSPLTQDLTINGSFSNRISYSLFDRLIANYNDIGSGYGYSGEVFTYESGKDGFDINLACDLNSLLSSGDGVNGGVWGYVEAWKTNSIGMLGFFVRDPDTNERGILTEGYIVLDGTNIDSPSIGAPLWFYQEGDGSGPVPPPLPFRTSLYSGASPFTIYQRLLGHLCYADRNNLWILRFKPSNDWIQI